MKIFILEDDLLTGTNLVEALKAHGYENILYVQSEFGALAAFQEFNPDIALIDVRIGNQKDGIDLVNDFNKIKEVPTIYITGEQNHEIINKAKLTNPANYMLKPINPDELAINIELAIHNFSLVSKREKALETPKKLKSDSIFTVGASLFIKTNNKFQKLAIDDILWIQADNVYIQIALVNEKKVTLAMPLKRFEEQVSHPTLIKLNRSQVVNISHIDSFESQRVFIGSQQFRITENYKPNFLRVLGH